MRITAQDYADFDRDRQDALREWIQSVHSEATRETKPPMVIELNVETFSDAYVVQWEVVALDDDQPALVSKSYVWDTELDPPHFVADNL